MIYLFDYQGLLAAPVEPDEELEPEVLLCGGVVGLLLLFGEVELPVPLLLLLPGELRLPPSLLLVPVPPGEVAPPVDDAGEVPK